MCSKLTVNGIFIFHLIGTPCSSVSIVNFEQVNAYWVQKPSE